MSISNFKGKKHSEKSKKQISKTRTGKGLSFDNGKWKGKEVGYRAIHSWIKRMYGSPTTCEHCQTGNLTGHSIHWASKTLEYTRDRENWLRLCAKCHGIFDTINNLRKHKK